MKSFSTPQSLLVPPALHLSFLREPQLPLHRVRILVVLSVPLSYRAQQSHHITCLTTLITPSVPVPSLPPSRHPPQINLAITLNYLKTIGSYTHGDCVHCLNASNISEQLQQYSFDLSAAMI